ncbi:hypothetical protein ACWEWI_25915 [Streptomyces sp. NPDC003753]
MAVRRDRREPMDRGAAIGALITERACEPPAAGASLRERWETIAPELAGRVAAVGYGVGGLGDQACLDRSSANTAT